MSNLRVKSQSQHPVQWREAPMVTTQADPDHIEPGKVWNSIWTRRYPILALVVASVIVAGVVSTKITPRYAAQSVLEIQPDDPKLLQKERVSDNTTITVSDYVSTQMALIQSRVLAERVVRELGLDKNPEFDPRQQISLVTKARNWLGHLVPALAPDDTQALTDTQAFNAATYKFMDQTKIAAVGKSQLVGITVAMTNPELAAAAANALATDYIARQQETRVGGSKETTAWMDGRLVELRAALKESEDKLQKYRDAQGLVDVGGATGGVSTITSNELAATSDRMIDATRQRAEAESQWRQIQGMKGAGLERLASEPAVMQDPVVQQFRAEVAKAQAKVDEMSKRYGDKYPAMISARSDLNAAQASLRSQVQQVVGGIERNYQLAVANEGSLRASVNNSKNQIQDISRKEFQLRDLQRDVDSNRQLYDSFQAHMRETAATGDVQAQNIKVVDPAIAPLLPSSPNKPLIIFIAGLVALLVGVGYALIRDAIKNTFRSSDDIRKQINLPIWGVVPMLRKRRNQTIGQQYELNEDGPFCEAIRTLRTNVMLNDNQSSNKVVVMTSSIPGEGKSAIAVNLAFALGKLERVLLIEADLRRPTLARNLGLTGTSLGLADLIAGHAKPEECIQSFGRIDMLTVGTLPENPLELLASPRFGQFLEWVKGSYDRILIDTPASQAVSDAALICTLADSVIYVIKSQSTSVALAQKGINQLVQSGAPMRGVVLNQVDLLQQPNQNHLGAYEHYGALQIQ
ncbi:polysaccharide biosynthesis tyrosine autokinase [Pseudomonas sp. HR96]|uniref:GumC family protein n=1 Tax=Pseudomonas sp. HR96 TaxID=1027966 RepID=UPI002A74EB03|nr:polysaccharide biosynthesis tyrosine autokinase [Pseudomonas sp. HR96]WPO99706.1 polysaccharide biosynthesis tyrosine autokinase [Pseudomonas sp. HR96]